MNIQRTTWQVDKIGGEPITHAEHVIRLAKRCVADENIHIFVVSAFAGVTNALEDAFAAYMNGRTQAYKDKRDMALYEAKKILIENIKNYLDEDTDLQREAVSNIDTFLDPIREMLPITKAAKIKKENATTIRDQVVRFGEVMTAKILESVLKNKKIDVESICAAQFDETNGDFSTETMVLERLVECLRQTVRKQIVQCLNGEKSKRKIIILPGHVKSSEGHMIGKLKRGFTDTTATALVAAIKRETGDEVRGVFWKMSAGVQSVFHEGDGEEIKGPTIPSMSFQELAEAGAGGVECIHPHVEHIAIENNLHLASRSIVDQDKSGTEFTPEDNISKAPFKLLAPIDTVLIKVSHPAMSIEIGWLKSITTHFQKKGLSIDLVSTAGKNVTYSVNLSTKPSQRKGQIKALKALKQSLTILEVGGVRYEPRINVYERACISCVGAELTRDETIAHIKNLMNMHDIRILTDSNPVNDLGDPDKTNYDGLSTQSNEQEPRRRYAFIIKREDVSKALTILETYRSSRSEK